MAEETENEATTTDLFQTLKATNERLVDVLARQDSGTPTTYISPPAPVPKRANYLLYVGLGVLALVMFGKLKVKI